MKLLNTKTLKQRYKTFVFTGKVRRVMKLNVHVLGATGLKLTSGLLVQ